MRYEEINDLCNRTVQSIISKYGLKKEIIKSDLYTLK
jgi:hypothetical protein